MITFTTLKRGLKTAQPINMHVWVIDSKIDPRNECERARLFVSFVSVWQQYFHQHNSRVLLSTEHFEAPNRQAPWIFVEFIVSASVTVVLQRFVLEEL